MRTLTAGVVLGVGLLIPEAVQANDYLVSKVRNETSFGIGFAFQWGDGPWVDRRLEPGQDFDLYWNLGSGPAPLRINFDADPGPGQDRVFYQVRTYLHPTSLLIGPPTEAFRVRPDGRIDLFRTRP